MVGGIVKVFEYDRSTRVTELLIYPSSDKALLMMVALSDFGFDDAGMPTSIFESAGGAIHLGNELNRSTDQTQGCFIKQFFKTRSVFIWNH